MSDRLVKVCIVFVLVVFIAYMAALFQASAETAEERRRVDAVLAEQRASVPNLLLAQGMEVEPLATIVPPTSTQNPSLAWCLIIMLFALNMGVIALLLWMNYQRRKGNREIEHKKSQLKLDIKTLMNERRKCMIFDLEHLKAFEINMPPEDTNVVLKFPGGRNVEIQCRTKDADYQYNGSLTMILPEPKPISILAGSPLGPAHAIESTQPHNRLGTHVITELPDGGRPYDGEDDSSEAP